MSRSKEVPIIGLVRVILAGVSVAFTLGCAQDRGERAWILPESTLPADVSALARGFNERGGAVLIQLTGWATEEAINDLVAAGLAPLPGYDAVERLDSMGMNIVGGVILPNRLPMVLQRRYVLRITPLDTMRTQPTTAPSSENRR